MEVGQWFLIKDRPRVLFQFRGFAYVNEAYATSQGGRLLTRDGICLVVCVNNDTKQYEFLPGNTLGRVVRYTPKGP